MRWKLIFPAAALFVALTGTAAYAATDAPADTTGAATDTAAATPADTAAAAATTAVPAADPSIAAAAAAATTPGDWGPPPKGGARACELWVDPPAGVQVTVSDVSFNGVPSSFTETRTYDVSATGPGEVDFPLDPAIVPTGDVQVAFTAGWELSTQTAQFSGTIHCSDPTPPTPPAPPEVGGVTIERPATQVEAATASNDTLPFTGADHTLVLVVAGVALVGLGALGVSRSRRNVI
jgi:LPXTG-motif cell wall-anchored protein